MVLMECWGNHLWHSVPQGPFWSSKAWVEARLSLIKQECRFTVAKYSEMYNFNELSRNFVQVAKQTLKIFEMLERHIISEFFPSSEEDEAEHSMLCHHDLSMCNILVDEAGALTGVIDWECVSAVPLWKACNYPSFLRADPLDQKPDRANYGDKDGCGKYSGSEETYWEDMLKYELILLRSYFLDEMRRLEPGWVEVFEASAQKRTFDFVVHYCIQRQFKEISVCG